MYDIVDHNANVRRPMQSVEFLKPTLKGLRFEGHAIPLEFLADLAALEEMLFETAKWRFLDANPSRSRCPRNFLHGVSLKLTGVEDGSAKPVISLVLAANLLFGNDAQYLEDARDSIVDAIVAADAGNPVKKYLPEKILRYFDRFGRSLRDGEAIEFTVSTKPTATLTKQTRRELVLAAGSANEVAENVVVYGRIPEADQSKSTFQIQLWDGRKITAPMGSNRTDVLEAFNKYPSGARVKVEGVGKITRANKLQSMESVDTFNMLDDLDTSARLDEFKYLRPGWLDGDGEPLSADGLDWLAGAFDDFYSQKLPLPYLFPTAEGRVRAEWTVKTFEMSLEIDLDNHTANWHACDVERDSEETFELNLNRPGDWTTLVDMIGKATGITP